MPLTQKNHVQLKLSKKHRLLFLYKKAYSSSESKAFFKSYILSYAGYSSECFSIYSSSFKIERKSSGLKTSSLFSKFSIINTTSYKNNNILKVKYQQQRVQPRTLLTDYKFNTILYILYINIIV